MIKSFISWLNEEIAISNKVKSPVEVELITGNVITLINPENETWQALLPQLKEYTELLKEISFAIAEDNPSKIATAIAKAQKLSLFKKEPTEVWIKDRIEKQEPMRSDVDFDRWVARYIENKLGSFIAWAENKK